MQRRLELDFGAAHGWRLLASTFGLVTLARGKRHSGGRRYDADDGNGHWSGGLHASFDHPYYYRRDGEAAAIVARCAAGRRSERVARPRLHITG
jgi:hypothetical protein